MQKWQVQEAKSKFSELMEKAEAEGPQVITRNGKDRTVMISIDAYREKFEPEDSIIEYLLGGPKFDDFLVERNPELGRDVRPFDE